MIKQPVKKIVDVAPKFSRIKVNTPSKASPVKPILPSHVRTTPPERNRNFDYNARTTIKEGFDNFMRIIKNK